MKTAFDFSKVKKAGKAKSLNDLYAGARSQGNKGDEPLYDNRLIENKAVNELEKSKSALTIDRRRRERFGGKEQPTPAEYEEISKMLKYGKNNQDMEKSQYAKDFFEDFYNMDKQTQIESKPNRDKLLRDVDTRVRGFLNEDYPSSGPIDRETAKYFGSANNEHLSFPQLGRYPTTEELNSGILGTIDIGGHPKSTGSGALRIHTHINSPRNLEPSDTDYFDSESLGNSYVMKSGDGKLLQFGTAKNGKPLTPREVNWNIEDDETRGVNGRNTKALKERRNIEKTGYIYPDEGRGSGQKGTDIKSKLNKLYFSLSQ